MSIIIFIMKIMELIHREIRQLVLDHIASKWWNHGGIKFVKKNHTGLEIRCCFDCVNTAFLFNCKGKVKQAYTYMIKISSNVGGGGHGG